MHCISFGTFFVPKEESEIKLNHIRMMECEYVSGMPQPIRQEEAIGGAKHVIVNFESEVKQRQVSVLRRQGRISWAPDPLLPPLSTQRAQRSSMSLAMP